MTALRQKVAILNGHDPDYDDEPDYLAAERAAALEALAAQPAQEDRAEQLADLAEHLESWQPIDLGPVIDGHHTTPVPEILETRDGTAALFYRGAVNGVHGDSGIGKSWIVLAAVAQVVASGRRALVIDYEANAMEIVARLKALGCSRPQMLEQLTYISPNAPMSELAIAAVLQQVAPETDLVVIDSLGEAFGLDGIDENSDAEVGPWFRNVARRIADAGPAVALVDHGTKASDNPLHPSGSKRKRAAITGASYLVTTTRPPTRDQAGALTLTCAKDRHGTYARGKVVATAEVTPYPDGGVTVAIHQVTGDAGDAPDGMVQAVARAVLRLVQAEGRPMSRAEIEARVQTKARATTKRAAMDLLVGRGALTDQAGPRGARLHAYVHDLEQEPAA